MNRRRVLANILCAVALCAVSPVLAESQLKPAQPETVGISPERLQRLTETFEAEVNKGAIPGAVIMVARKGKIAYVKAFGFQDREKQVPMTTDSIFRIASMSKPFTSVAVMMLVEQGKIMLTDPVSAYLPQLKGLQVGVEKPDANGKPELTLEPARNEATIQDLLRHTSGLIYGGRGTTAVHKLYPAGSTPAATGMTGAEFLDRLSGLPLLYQPGTVWDYGFGLDIAGLVIEQIGGEPLGRHLTRALDPSISRSDCTAWRQF